MKKNSSFIFGLTLLFLYLIFSELILPPNKYLPSPGLLYDSLVSLINNYSFISRTGEFLLWTYFPAIILIAFFYYLRLPVIKIFNLLSGSYKTLNLFYFVPFIGAVIYITMLVKNAVASEIIISAFIISGGIKFFIARSLSSLDDVYLNAAKGLGKNNNLIINEVIAKQILPEIKASLISAHLLFLNAMLIVELVLRTNLGGLFYDLLCYKDTTGVFVVTVFLAFLFGINHYLLKLILNKIVYWE